MCRGGFSEQGSHKDARERAGKIHFLDDGKVKVKTRHSDYIGAKNVTLNAVSDVMRAVTFYGT